MRSGAKRGGVPCQARKRMNGPRNYQRIITDNFIMPPGKLIGRFIQPSERDIIRAFSYEGTVSSSERDIIRAFSYEGNRFMVVEPV